MIMAWPQNQSSYFARKLWVNMQKRQIHKVEYYTSDSNKQKTLFLSDFITINGFTTPGKMLMDMGNGNKSVMQITSYEPEIGLNEEIFSKSFLIKL